MRGSAKVTKVPVILTRQSNYSPVNISGRSKSIYSLTPTERHKQVVEYLKSSSPSIPNYQSSSHSNIGDSSPVEGSYRINIDNTDKSKLTLVSKKKGNKEIKGEKAKKCLSDEMLYFENFQNLKFFLMNSKIPVLREERGFFMEKKVFEHKFPSINKKLRNVKGFNNY